MVPHLPVLKANSAAFADLFCAKNYFKPYANKWQASLSGLMGDYRIEYTICVCPCDRKMKKTCVVVDKQFVIILQPRRID